MVSKRPRSESRAAASGRRRGARKKTSNRKAKGTPQRWWIRWLLKPLLFVGLATGLFGGMVLWNWSRDLPDVQKLLSYDPPQTTRVRWLSD